jgi:hypothetical protein
MITLEGTELASLPIAGLRKVGDIDAFDGPLICHFRDTGNDDYLYYWCDCDAAANRWMVLRVGESELLRLANGVAPLHDVIPAAAKDDFVYFVEIDGNNKAARVLQVPKGNVPADYMPETGTALRAGD